VLLFEDSVSNVEELCNRAGVQSVDCVISGLPWATFSETLQVECLDAMMRVLKPGGRFATFSYVHSLALTNSRRFANRLPKYFKTVSKSPVVWLNLPPAFCLPLPNLDVSCLPTSVHQTGNTAWRLGLLGLCDKTTALIER
jgi:phospholipid N-methyltransferase